MKSNKTIAILGGMGPQASAKLLQVIIDMAAKDFQAKDDDDFPEVILNSIPVPDFISDKNNVALALSMLSRRVKNLEAFNPVLFSIACNTAHIILPDLQKITSIPFISIIESVSESVSMCNISKVGLLGTPVTLKSALYQTALQKRNIQTVIPSNSNQKIVEKVIRNVLSGKIDDDDRQKLVKVAKTLQRNEAEGIILGCTELPLIFPKDFQLPVFDSIEILAKAMLNKCFNTRE